jgi:hypothetical protein
MSYGLIHKMAGAALIVETKSETEEISGMKRQQKMFKQFTFDPTKYDQLRTYSKVVTLKRTTSDEKTHKTQQDSSDGSSPTTPQDSGLEEEIDYKTQKTQDKRGYKNGDLVPIGRDILEDKSRPPSQDGSSGSGGFIEEADHDPPAVQPGSTLGLGGDQISESCLACGTPIGVGHGTYSGYFCASCGPKVSMIRASAKAHTKGFTTGELWEDLAMRGRPPRREFLPAMLHAIGYVEFEGTWMQQPPKES